MNCEQARELAALAASGDLTPVEQGAFELHLAGCPGCRAEADGFAEFAEQMAAMREESPPEYVYGAVRARVAAEISGRRKGWLAAWPAFVAAAACTLVLVIALRPTAPVVKESKQDVAAGNTEIASVPDALPVSPAAPVVRPLRRPALRASPQEPADPVIVHLFTDDPDVVIYWVADAGPKRSQKEIN